MKEKTENPRIIHEFEGGPSHLFWQDPSWFGPHYKSEDMKPIVLKLCKYHQVFVDHKITPTLDAVAWEKMPLAVPCEECDECSADTCPKSEDEVGEKGSGMKMAETLEGWFIDLGKCTPWDDIVRLKAENEKLKLQIEKIKAACKEAAEMLGDMVDVANIIGSACLYRRDIEDVMRVVTALVMEEGEENEGGG